MVNTQVNIHLQSIKNAGARNNHEKKCERVTREESGTISGAAVSLPHQEINVFLPGKAKVTCTVLRAGKTYYI